MPGVWRGTEAERERETEKEGGGREGGVVRVGGEYEYTCAKFKE